MGCRTYERSIAIAPLCWLTRLSCRVIHMQTWRPTILLHPPLHSWWNLSQTVCYLRLRPVDACDDTRTCTYKEVRLAMLQ